MDNKIRLFVVLRRWGQRAHKATVSIHAQLARMPVLPTLNPNFLDLLRNTSTVVPAACAGHKAHRIIVVPKAKIRPEPRANSTKAKKMSLR